MNTLVINFEWATYQQICIWVCGGVLLYTIWYLHVAKGHKPNKYSTKCKCGKQEWCCVKKRTREIVDSEGISIFYPQFKNLLGVWTYYTSSPYGHLEWFTTLETSQEYLETKCRCKVSKLHAP